MTKEEHILVKDLWQAWKDLAEMGQVTISPRFNRRYDAIEKRIKKLNVDKNIPTKGG